MHTFTASGELDTDLLVHIFAHVQYRLTFRFIGAWCRLMTTPSSSTSTASSWCSAVSSTSAL